MAKYISITNDSSLPSLLNLSLASNLSVINFTYDILKIVRYLNVLSFCPFIWIVRKGIHNNPENQNFEKKKSPGDIIILHLCIYHK